MRILLAHNSYQRPGGEDVAYEADVELLKTHDHEVFQYLVNNDRAESMSRASLASATLWNRRSSRDISRLIHHWRPDVLHLHNTFLMLSPSAAATGRMKRVPVVQTLHNFRLLCPNAQMFRQGQRCSDCVQRAVPWPSVLHRCFRDSRSATAVVALSLLEQRLLRRWDRSADLFTVLTEYSRSLFVGAGFDADRIVTRPNFLASDPGSGCGAGGFAMFAGRLAPEKGVRTLLDCWSRFDELPPLVIVGDGPLHAEVHAAAQRDARIEAFGWLPRADVIERLKNAAVLIVPSVWAEGMPQIIVESLAVGTPVIASRVGAMEEMICHEETGLLFRPADSVDLAASVQRALGNTEGLGRMRVNARRRFQERHSSASNYDALMEIYETAARRSQSLSRMTLSEAQ